MRGLVGVIVSFCKVIVIDVIKCSFQGLIFCCFAEGVEFWLLLSIGWGG